LLDDKQTGAGPGSFGDRRYDIDFARRSLT
jgi:hypothetical protein